MWPCLIYLSNDFLLHSNNPYNPVGSSKSGWHKFLLQSSGNSYSGIISLSHNIFSSSHVVSFNLDASLWPLCQLGAGSAIKERWFCLQSSSSDGDESKMEYSSHSNQCGLRAADASEEGLLVALIFVASPSLPINDEDGGWRWFTFSVSEVFLIVERVKLNDFNFLLSLDSFPLWLDIFAPPVVLFGGGDKNGISVAYLVGSNSSFCSSSNTCLAKRCLAAFLSENNAKHSERFMNFIISLESYPYSLSAFSMDVVHGRPRPVKNCLSLWFDDMVWRAWCGRFRFSVRRCDCRVRIQRMVVVLRSTLMLAAFIEQWVRKYLSVYILVTVKYKHYFYSYGN